MEKSKGFTIIELLVVVSIMLIFIGSTIAQYNTYTEQTKLKNEAKKLIDVLELAKKKASSGDLNKLTCDGGFLGYEVKIETGRYFLNLRCAIAPTSQLIATYNFSSSNITIQPGTGLFRFKQLAVGLEYKVDGPTDPSNPPIIQIKNSVIDKCVNISISPIGIIELNETLATCI